MTNILYVCEMPAFHVSNEVYVLKKFGFNVTVLNVFKRTYGSINDDIGIEDVKLINFYKNLRFYPSVKYLPLYTSFINKNVLRDIINVNKIDVIYSSWSSVVLQEASLLKIMFPHLRWVHRFLMYPASLNKYKVWLENYTVWQKLALADSVIVHTETMRDYLADKVHPNLSSSAVIIEKFNERYFCDDHIERFSESDDNKHVIFLGNIATTSDASSLLSIVKDLSTHVTVHFLDTNVVRNVFEEVGDKVKFFCKKKVGKELSCFIKRFDGVLACYSEKGRASDRVNNVIPNRVTLALPSMIPIFIPQDQLLGCQKELYELDCLYPFSSVKDFEKKLQNLDKTHSLKQKKLLCLGEEFVRAISGSDADHYSQ